MWSLCQSGQNSCSWKKIKTWVRMERILLWSNEQNSGLPWEKLMCLKVIYNLCWFNMNFFSGFGGGGFPFGGGHSHDEDDGKSSFIQKLMNKSITPSTIKCLKLAKKQLLIRSKNSTEKWPKSGTLIDQEEMLPKLFFFNLVQRNFWSLWDSKWSWKKKNVWQIWFQRTSRRRLSRYFFY